ncbi:hypothetical protein RM549_02145 [Salegentibacter sp. F188]|uniref:Uncharacterized protein n=1 Tax=Autumnicola patrickiae TaxID=3075591 RepID=A0ABU3DXV9_9FLAO|nr:hypothetical protein [Salegentibacter sp. F188]MDT0688565.1 hypothetical protein [Salegentibacter sp. F188]
MENPEEKNNTPKPDPEKSREKILRQERTSRKSTASGEKAKETSYRDHKNPFIRAISRTGYTVWVIGMAIALVLAFIVSVALL